MNRAQYKCKCKVSYSIKLWWPREFLARGIGQNVHATINPKNINPNRSYRMPLSWRNYCSLRLFSPCSQPSECLSLPLTNRLAWRPLTIHKRLARRNRYTNMACQDPIHCKTSKDELYSLTNSQLLLFWKVKMKWSRKRWQLLRSCCEDVAIYGSPGLLGLFKQIQWEWKKKWSSPVLSCWFPNCRATYYKLATSAGELMGSRSFVKRHRWIFILSTREYFCDWYEKAKLNVTDKKQIIWIQLESNTNIILRQISYVTSLEWDTGLPHIHLFKHMVVRVLIGELVTKCWVPVINFRWRSRINPRQRTAASAGLTALIARCCRVPWFASSGEDLQWTFPLSGGAFPHHKFSAAFEEPPPSTNKPFFGARATFGVSRPRKTVSSWRLNPSIVFHWSSKKMPPVPIEWTISKVHAKAKVFSPPIWQLHWATISLFGLEFNNQWSSLSKMKRRGSLLCFTSDEMAHFEIKNCGQCCPPPCWCQHARTPLVVVVSWTAAVQEHLRASAFRRSSRSKNVSIVGPLLDTARVISSCHADHHSLWCNRLDDFTQWSLLETFCNTTHCQRTFVQSECTIHLLVIPRHKKAGPVAIVSTPWRSFF